MAVSGEREESSIPPPPPNPRDFPPLDSNNTSSSDILNLVLPYHSQMMDLLQQILNKLNDIHEELANQPMIMVDEDGNMVSTLPEGSEDDSPV